MPELVFSRHKDAPRLEIGKTYSIPTTDGEEVSAVPEQAVMIEAEKRAVGVFTTENASILATCPVADEELKSYNQYPDTFFGAPTQPPRKIEDPIGLFDFFYETYQHTPRERLLEFMEGAPDIEELKALSQKDLAIKYCERNTWALVHEREKQEAVESPPVCKHAIELGRAMVAGERLDDTPGTLNNSRKQAGPKETR